MIEKFFKAIAILFCFLLMIGFGVCGIAGIVGGITNGGFGLIGIGFGLIGVGISVGCFFIVRNILKVAKTNDKPPTP